MERLTLAKDLAVDLQEDRPGMLARAAEAIASGGLNLDGFAEIEGILHMLTSDPWSARLALEAAGLRLLAEREVLVVQAEDRAGAAATVFGRLAAARINVTYAYVASRNRLIIATATDEVQKALAILGE
jgi:hypothetical protein